MRQTGENMRRVSICLAAIALLSACAGTVQMHYVSPYGGFICGPFAGETRSEAAFGPHGGTVRFINEGSLIPFERLDVEEFDPVVGASALLMSRGSIYKGYLAESTLPLIRKGVPDARLLVERESVINGFPVYESAIFMRESSSGVNGQGKRLDGIRGQIQYTNGRYMYTASVVWGVLPGDSLEKSTDLALHNAGLFFKKCKFPSSASVPDRPAK
jgi:hypothetical protein